MKPVKVEFRIEGLNTDGEWHMIDGPLSPEGDHLTHRDHVIEVLRQRGITRYSQVRVMKYVTTAEQVGGKVSV